MVGYWFAVGSLPDGAVLLHGDGRAVVIGETLTVDPPIIPCEHGLHASKHPFDALQFAPGPLLYKVRLSGEIIKEADKVTASERTALAVIDATDLLRVFARQQALSVIHLWNSPDVLQRYLETGDESLVDAARNAVRDAAWAAAGAAWAEAAARAAAWAEAAARAAVRDARQAAPVRDAAWDAAGAAWAAAWAAVWADAAAWDAAWDAARDAARAAARAAVRAAAVAAARAAARKNFKRLVDEAFRAAA